MTPKPFSASNHFTVPCGISCSCTPRVGGSVPPTARAGHCGACAVLAACLTPLARHRPPPPRVAERSADGRAELSVAPAQDLRPLAAVGTRSRAPWCRAKGPPRGGPRALSPGAAARGASPLGGRSWSGRATTALRGDDDVVAHRSLPRFPASPLRRAPAAAVPGGAVRVRGGCPGGDHCGVGARRDPGGRHRDRVLDDHAGLPGGWDL